MKKRSLILAVALALTTVFGTVGPVVHAENSSDYEVIYRMYNPNSGEHFYTSNAEERANLYLQGWDAEDIGWIAPKESENTVPVYRLYTEGTGSGGDHHYTTEEGEREYLLSIGWKDEGILCQAVKQTAEEKESGTTPEGATPLYRNYNPNAVTGAHNYTPSYGEYANLINIGWNDEKIAWYALDVDTKAFTLPELPKRPEKPNIENTESYATIEADVKLGGAGTGNHAKLVFQTDTSAVSFGIQYDACAVAPYTGKTMYLVENVAHNGAGGQTYTRYGETTSNEWHHLMMTYSQDGTLSFYVDGNCVGSESNVSLATSGTLYCSVEGSARLNGDTVNAQFRNIKIKGHGKYDPNQGFNSYPTSTNPGITVDKSGFVWSTGDVNISGTIVGLAPGQDWDNAYGSVSGVVRFSDGL